MVKMIIIYSTAKAALNISVVVLYRKMKTDSALSDLSESDNSPNHKMDKRKACFCYRSLFSSR